MRGFTQFCIQIKFRTGNVTKILTATINCLFHRAWSGCWLRPNGRPQAPGGLAHKPSHFYKLAALPVEHFERIERCSASVSAFTTSPNHLSFPPCARNWPTTAVLASVHPRALTTITKALRSSKRKMNSLPVLDRRAHERPPHEALLMSHAAKNGHGYRGAIHAGTRMVYAHPPHHSFKAVYTESLPTFAMISSLWSRLIAKYSCPSATCLSFADMFLNSSLRRLSCSCSYLW